ncbi:MAG: glycosyltransferase family 2 protein [Anaerolineae bacterium]
MTEAHHPLRASIIIPMYNAGHCIAGCLESVLHQTIPPAEYEVIVVDDASTDGSAELVRAQYPAVRVICSQENGGFAPTCNLGAGEAKGQWVVFLNADTRLAPDWLEQMLRAAERDAGAGAVQCAQIYLWRRPSGSSGEALYYLDLCPWGFTRYYPAAGASQPIPTLFLSGAGCMVRRDWLAENWPPFDPLYRMYGEDRDLGLRIITQGYRIYAVPAARLWHDHPNPLEHPRMGLRKAVLSARNGWLAYLKNMYLLEFLLYAPVVLAGSFLRAWEFPGALWRRLAAGLGYFLLTLIYLPRAFWFYLVRYPDVRRQNLRRRTRSAGWLFKQLCTPTARRTWS